VPIGTPEGDAIGTTIEAEIGARYTTGGTARVARMWKSVGTAIWGTPAWKIRALTADPASPVVGEMWLRSDL